MYLVTMKIKEQRMADKNSPYNGAVCTVGDKVHFVTSKIGPDLNATEEGARESLRGKEFPFEDYLLRVISVEEYLREVGDYQTAPWLNDMRVAAQGYKWVD